VQLTPDDPAPHNSLATVLWLQLLFNRGAVTVDHYLGSFSRPSVDLKKPPPDGGRRVPPARRTRARPRRAAPVRGAPDVQAQYDLGVALGLLASYTATVEGRMMAGFRAARRSFDLHETVLSRDPGRVESGVVVGMYRYIISTLSLPMRAMAYIVGFGGGKEEGIGLLQAAAASRTESRSDALFALVLIYNREERYDEALAVLRELRVLYPRNRLLALESGATALRAGRAERGGGADQPGDAQLQRDSRPRVPGELALWHYKRGAARARAGNTEGAEADLRIAAGPEALPWVSGRARVELGRLALARGDRAAARDQAAQAQALCRQGNDGPCVDSARRLQRSAHGR
jgi:tetratricopeptide (TPR) repeat protein